ncbi:CDP-diacylglycerol diphosphatase [Methylobacterium planeticum]|uniref:CDP-diacylglycerol pyrophosphatase n=1 Tax=Methylobacterium planeticum TaxID=2615211 RepID=A0A6N6MR20_9HYPH|nr:CDP-diacylglycerol diphosphatase [Methylobacterium planeticum]KAB1071748.1 CDP-diacylglycerol diphosphatase [Methylobacterium planeticum]
MRATAWLSVLLASAAWVASPAQAVPNPSRNVLWAALQGCILAKKATGRMFPCLSVDLGDKDRPGAAVLRAPGAATHLVVMPTDDVSGIEAPQLQRSAGNAYWRAALAARPLVTEALKGRLPLDRVGMAVNSAGGRSQDQLHIHVDCIEPRVRTALLRHGQAVRDNWTTFPIALQGRRFFAMRVRAADVDGFNPFAALTHLPGKSTDLRAVGIAVFSTARDDPAPGFIVLANRASGSFAGELLLDHTCAEASQASTQ